MSTETSKTKQPCTIDSVKGSLFYEKPQERAAKGKIKFIKNGQAYTESIVYSKPCERCVGCPVYRVDKSTTPTAYYCQAGFLFGAFRRAIEEGTIPKNCRVVDVRVALHCH